MKQKLFVVAFLSVAALAGCGKKKAAALAGADACAAAAKAFAAVTIANLKNVYANVDPASEGAIASTVQAHCVNDKWGEDVAKCFTDTKSQTALYGCTKLLSEELRQAFNKDLDSVRVQKAAPAASPPPASGSGSAEAPPAEGSGSAEAPHAEGSGSAEPSHAE